MLNYAWRDYGVRVGIWRLMEILERQGFAPRPRSIPKRAALPADRRGRQPTGLGMDGARRKQLVAVDRHARGCEASSQGCSTRLPQTGQRPRGWLGPALTETDNTLDILAEAGIEYVADWCNDELPYTMRTRNGPMVAMPYTLEIGDIPIFLQHGGSGEDFYRMMVDQFDTLYEEGARRPRVFCIALHPFLVGHPFRARHLERVLPHIRKHGDVWLTTGSGIVDWYKSKSLS